MVEIQKNSFYRRQLISNAVALFPRFKDLSVGKETTVTLEAGMNPRQYVLSGAVSSSPSYGTADLNGGYLQFFVSGTILSGAAKLPVAEVYKVIDGIGPVESKDTAAGTPAFELAKYDYNGPSAYPGAGAAGTYAPDPVGNNVTVLSSYLDGDNVWLEENFDGADKTLGTFSMLGDQGTATLSMKDIYLKPKMGEEKIFAGGDAFFGGGASDDISDNIEKYFSDKPSGEGTARCYIRPMKKNRINGIWTATTDNRNEKQKWQIYAPFWKWKDIVGVIEFGSTTPATDDMDAAKEANENNTIFNHIAVQSAFGNVFTASPSTPLLDSVVELSTSKKASGGQSLRMYHMWQSIEASPNTDAWTAYKLIERGIGKSVVNPQVSRCSLYNIPKPAFIDIGALNYPINVDEDTVDQTLSGATMLSGAHLTDKRVSFPEINIKMNISKLYPSPQLATGTSNFGSGSVFCHPYTDAGTNDKWIAKKYANNDAVFGDAKGGLNTFLRSVVVTFSNYTPEAYATLDSFLAASLNDFYSFGSDQTTAFDPAGTRKFACGVVFQTFYGDSEYGDDYAKDQDLDPNLIYASALPMARYNTASVSGVTGLLASGALAYFDSNGVAEGGELLVRDARIGIEQVGENIGGGCCNIGQGQADYAAKTDCTGTTAGGTWRDYKSPRYNIDNTGNGNSLAGMPWGDSGSLHEPLFVKIKKDEWFNMKVVFDGYAPYGISRAWDSGGNPAANASGGTYCQSVGPDVLAGTGAAVNDYNVGGQQANYANDFGVPMRIFFEGAEVGGENSDGDDSKQLPFLNIAMPGYNTARNANDVIKQGTSSIYGSNWPKHMTIWVQNYRYTAYSSSASSGDYIWWRGQYLDGSTTANVKYRAADSKIHPDGLDAEAEVFIDNITFKNWNNEHVNHSINAGQLQRFIQLGQQQISSPVVTYYDAAEATAMMKGFHPSGTFQTHNPGHYLLIGVNNPKDFPLSGKYDTTVTDSATNINTLGDGLSDNVYNKNSLAREVYQLWNNFSTGDLGNLIQATPEIALVSTLAPVKNTSGGYGFVPYKSGLYNWRMGDSLRSRPFARYSPFVSGAYTPASTGAHSLNAGEKLEFTGWVIDNHASQAANQAAWSGVGYAYAATGATFNNPSFTDTAVTFYAGFNYVNTTGGSVVYDNTNAPDDDGFPDVPFGSYISMGGGLNTFYSTDALTQKGFVRVDIDNVSNSGSSSGVYGSTGGGPEALGYDKYSKWAPRENILASAKILGIEQSYILGGGSLDESLTDASLIVVDNPEIFSVEADDDYIIYSLNANEPDAYKMLPNNADGTGKWPDAGAATGLSAVALGFHTTVKLATVKQPIQGNTIALAVFNSGSSLSVVQAAGPRTDGIKYADDGTTELGIGSNLSDLWISPKKYWLTMAFINNDSASRRNYESIAHINSRPDDSDANQLGSTFNEFSYSYNTAVEALKGESGLTSNPWILNPGGETTTLDLQDFGHGSYDKDKDTGGQVAIHSTLTSRLNDVDISPVVAGGAGAGGMPGQGSAPSEKPIVLTLGLSNLTSQKKVIIYGDEYSGSDSLNIYNPSFIWQYNSPLPEVKEFVVAPAFDGLKKDVNLYELQTENLNAINFTWAETGDIWYRILMIDDVPIRNKYHKAKLWLPLNEKPVDSTPTTSASYNWYTDSSSAAWSTYGSSGTIAGDGVVGDEILADVQGLQGYAPHLISGTAAADGIIQLDVTGNDGLISMTEFTLVVHTIPDDAASNTDTGGAFIYSQGDGSSNGFDIHLNEDSKIIVQMSGASMASTSVIPTDGETPTAIIVTYLSGSSGNGYGPDLQLYINGRLEDYVVSGSGAVAANSATLLGAQSSKLVSTIYKGLIEEVIIYEKRWEILEDSQLYLYNTAPLLDVNASTDKIITHNARLFLFDHHNIRGKNRDEVCVSNPIAWKVTA